MGRMMKMGANTLPGHLVGFFATYLPKLREASPNTIRAYRDAILQLLEFAARKKGADFNDLGLDDIGQEVVEAFLLHLEKVRGAAPSTRNQRLAAIHSLFRYVQKHDLSTFDTCRAVLAIEKCKAPEPCVAYLSIEEMTCLLAQPDPSTAGLRHLAILSLLYESAARVQELADACVRDLDLTTKTVTLHGKGGKTRTVPIGKGMATILRRYLERFPRERDMHLFTGRHGLAISRSGIQYTIDRYVNLAKESHPGMYKKKVTAHVFRHSRAMHLLESGTNIVYISDLLGHASVVTTEIYAKANPETKRREIETHSKAITPTRKYNQKEMKDLNDWLRGIC
jgi:site-specific recombinase XerD